MSLPRVSCVVSSYNRPTLIRDAIESVLEQEGVEVQLIIADDYSNEATHDAINKAIRDCAQRLPMLNGPYLVIPPPGPVTTMQERHQNGGGRCAKAINAAMVHATGEFLALLPDDDFLVPGSLAVRAEFLREHPEANAVYGRVEACKPMNGKPQAGRHSLSDLDRMYPGQALGGGPWGFVSRGCAHDRNGFWSAEPITRAANKVDHGQMMVRNLDTLPQWPDAPSTGGGEHYDCPDAGWWYRLEYAGLGPFYGIDQVVVVKRYTAFGHRSDPQRRE